MKLKTIEWRAREQYRGKLASPDTIFEWSLLRRLDKKVAAGFVRKKNREAERRLVTCPAGAHIFEYRVKP